MRGRLHLEMPSFDCSLEAFSLRDTCNVYILTWDKVTGAHLETYGRIKVLRYWGYQVEARIPCSPGIRTDLLWGEGHASNNVRFQVS